MERKYLLLPVAMLFAWWYRVALPFTHGHDPLTSSWTWYHRDGASKGGITWSPCKENGSLPLKCATLAVPLDYTESQSKETLQLRLVKVDAMKGTKKGSILINPGGPGGGGREWLAGPYAEAQLVATGGAYDLIAFDTRGTGDTIPYSCYEDAGQRSNVAMRTPPFLNASDTALGTFWACKATMAKSCHHYMNHTGNLIGTASVARDMMQIVDALEEDGLLRYWGFSYGTLLGMTVAAMFPDRMDRLVLDGVLNPHEYYAGHNPEQVADSDATFARFLEACLEHPDNCALAKDTTVEEVTRKVDQLLLDLKYSPIAVGRDISTDIIDYGAVKSIMVASLYNTLFWPAFSGAIHGLLTGNLTPAIEYGAIFLGGDSIFPAHGHEAVHGIRCSDSSLRSDNLSALLPLLDQHYATSRLYGDVVSITDVTCAQWPFKAKEVYTGNFSVTTRSPILFIGNTYDPLTPLVSAQNASTGFAGSVVLQHDGCGHTSLAQPSLCTANVIRAYFEEGTLPAPGTKCQPSIPLFYDPTLKSDSKNGLVGRTEEETTLLAALLNLNSRYFPS